MESENRYVLQKAAASRKQPARNARGADASVRSESVRTRVWVRMWPLGVRVCKGCVCVRAWVCVSIARVRPLCALVSVLLIYWCCAVSRWCAVERCGMMRIQVVVQWPVRRCAAVGWHCRCESNTILCGCVSGSRPLQFKC